MNNIKQLFGLRVKELRIKQGLKQYQLGKLIKLNPKNISSIETGNSFASAPTIDKLAKALNVAPQALFNFAHLQEPTNLKKNIIKQLDLLSTHDLQLIYRIIELYLK